MDQGRKGLNIYITGEELQEIDTIISKKHVALDASKTTAFPEGMKSEVITSFYKAAFDNLAEAESSERGWWNRIRVKYNLKEKTFLDTVTGEFYTLPEE